MFIVLTEYSGEQGKVEESMREMAAIEALKSEKADKEVSHLGCTYPHPKLKFTGL